MADLTFDPTLTELPILYEPCKHLCFHEQIQKMAHITGGVGLSEWLSLEHPLSLLCDIHVQGVMPYNLHKELYKGLRDQGVQSYITYQKKDIRFIISHCNSLKEYLLRSS